MMDSKDKKFFMFYQGAKKESGVQAYPFEIATEKREIDGKPVIVPKKLGDGSFGMVFEATSTSQDLGIYALKVLYKHRADGNNEEMDRIREELHIGHQLPKLLEDIVTHDELDKYDQYFPKQGNQQSRWLALPKAYSENFKDFIGREELEKQDIKFSKFAYIMEKFDKSLKDLVEEPIDSQPGGYGRLKRSTLKERECSAIPILSQLSRGLQVLHAAGLRHQDIKPGNIYVKTEGAKIVFRLGDLGFLKPHDPAFAGTVAASIDSIGIGTKHYRSIEQIDFNDTAECDVEIIEPTKDSKEQDTSITRATLTTRDPKFLETVMKEHDLAYFAKSNSRRLMRIDTIKMDPGSGLVKIEVTHKVPPGNNEQDGVPENNPLVKDTKTQVVFFKNPSAKTDLFGLGAILYDILTIGESPERFYELLRRYDKEDYDIEKSILNRYETWEAGTLEDADISAIFNRVNKAGKGGQNLRKEVLALLLKCMMSDASGSFYTKCNFEKAECTGESSDNIKARLLAVGAWAEVIQEIEDVGKTIDASEYDQHSKNVLTRTPAAASSITPESTSSTSTAEAGENQKVGLSAVLKAYLEGKPPGRSGTQSIDQAKRKAFRWLMGALLVKKIADKVDAYPKTLDSMWSLSPEHVWVKGEGIATWRRVFAKSDDLIKSLRTRDPLLTRIRPFSSRFEPIWWPYGTRRVRLTRVDDSGARSQTENDHEQLLKVDIDFFDFTFAAHSIKSGDFILPTDSSNSMVFRVKEPKNSHRLTLCVCVDDSSTERGRHDDQLTSGKLFENAYLIKNPNIVDYYAGMLSIYLYHFLISDGVGQRERITDFPVKIYPSISDFPIRFKQVPSQTMKESKISFWKDKGSTWEQLRDQTLKLVVWLSFGGFSFDKIGEPIEKETQRWARAFEEVQDWYSRVNKFALRRGQIDNWNMLTTEPNSSLFEDVMVEKFKEISHADWENICVSYIDSAMK